MVEDQQVQTGAIAPAYLESIEGRHRLLHREVHGEAGRARPQPGEIGDRGEGAQAVALDAPTGVLGPDEQRVDALDVVDGREVKCPLQYLDRRADRRGVGLERFGQRTVGPKAQHARQTQKKPVDVLEASDPVRECVSARRRHGRERERVSDRAQWHPHIGR
ncbi:unannotated protein [freshwater metagenome]|uniref:Unannotated protein n=1 Tax=freshwater metagenome TaxID=449393 RepID=A0A6J7PLZ6_9ZZZZ